MEPVEVEEWQASALRAAYEGTSGTRSGGRVPPIGMRRGDVAALAGPSRRPCGNQKGKKFHLLRAPSGQEWAWRVDFGTVVRDDPCMDRRSLERLGHYIVSRRVALGYRHRTDLASSLQFTVRTLADIEHGVRKASPGTYAMLENKLAWAPGSVDIILADGEPKEQVVKLRHPNSAPLSQASTEELLLELRRRIIALRRRRHETWDDWDDGLYPHGDWPEEA